MAFPLKMVMVYDGGAFVWEDNDYNKDTTIANVWDTNNYWFDDYTLNQQQQQDQQWHLAQELSNGKHQGVLARLAAAFCPDGQGIDLVHLTSVSVMEIDEKHLDIQTVICDNMGCVTVQVPIEFPEMCNNVYDEECILHQLEELDHIAEGMLQQRQSDQETDSARNEWLQQLQSQDVDDYPSWWVNSFWLAEDCIAMRRLLDGPDFAEEVKALTYAALPPDLSDWIVDHSVIRQVGPAGILMRALILKYDFGIENNEAQLINLSLKYDSVADSVEGLRQEVLHLVASTMETPLDADEVHNDYIENEGFNDPILEKSEMSIMIDDCQDILGEPRPVSLFDSNLLVDLKTEKTGDEIDLEYYKGSIVEDREFDFSNHGHDLLGDLPSMNNLDPAKILDEIDEDKVSVGLTGMESLHDSLVQEPKISIISDEGNYLIGEKQSIHLSEDNFLVDFEANDKAGDVIGLKQSIADESKISDLSDESHNLLVDPHSMNNLNPKKILDETDVHKVLDKIEGFHNSIVMKPEISDKSDIGHDLKGEQHSVRSLDLLVDVEATEKPCDSIDREQFENSTWEERKLSIKVVLGDLKSINNVDPEQILGGIDAHETQADSTGMEGCNKLIVNEHEISDSFDVGSVEDNLFVDIDANEKLNNEMMMEQFNNSIVGMPIPTNISYDTHDLLTEPYSMNTLGFNALKLEEISVNSSDEEHGNESMAPEPKMSIISESHNLTGYLPSMNVSDTRMLGESLDSNDTHIQHIELPAPCRIASRVTKELDDLKE
jgi:hypothetical protein